MFIPKDQLSYSFEMTQISKSKSSQSLSDSKCMKQNPSLFAPSVTVSKLLKRFSFNGNSKYNDSTAEKGRDKDFPAQLSHNVVDSSAFNDEDAFSDDNDDWASRKLLPGEKIFHCEQNTSMKDPKNYQSYSPEIKVVSLWDAALNGKVKDIADNIQNGADPNEKDDEGRTPLMIACARGAVEIVYFLLNDADMRVDVEATAVEGWTPLMIACMAGHEKVVKTLVEFGACLDKKDVIYGSSMLMWACSGGHVAVVKYLLEICGNSDLNRYINERNFEMWSPLMIATDAMNFDIVMLLASYGAELDYFNFNGATALDYAIQSNSIVIEAFFRRAKARSSRDFWIAVSGGDIDTVKDIIYMNPHMCNVVGEHGRNALMLSCKQNNFAMADFFCSLENIMINVQDGTFNSPLDIAIENENVDIVDLLVSHKGLDLQKADMHGWNVLMKVAALKTKNMKTQMRILRTLVDKGAEINHCNNNGGTVLDVAIDAKNMEVAKFLASKGAFSAADIKEQVELVLRGKRGKFKFWQ